jgi:hypothetical protein
MPSSLGRIQFFIETIKKQLGDSEAETSTVAIHSGTFLLGSFFFTRLKGLRMALSKKKELYLVVTRWDNI